MPLKIVNKTGAYENSPVSLRIVGNDGTAMSPAPVAAVLGAAYNRTTFTASADRPADAPGGFHGGGPAHHYAKAMQATEDGKAYGFAFDDVGGFASYIEDGAPPGITLTPTPF